MAGSYGTFITRFLSSLYAVLYKGCASLHSRLMCVRVPFPTFLQELCFDFHMIANLIEER